MNKSSFALALIFVGAFVSVNSLQCYVCQNCASGTLNDEQLVTCGAVTTTPTTATPTTVSPTTASPTTASPTTASPTTASPTTASPTTESSTTTSSTTTTTTTTTTLSPELPSSRVKRHVLPGVGLDSECSCRGEEGCDCSGFQGLRIANYEDVEYVCAQAILKANSTVMRDCAPSQIEGKAICDYLADYVTDCKTCNTDKCNSALTLQTSISLLLVVVSMALFK